MNTKINKLSIVVLTSIVLLFGCSKDFLDMNQPGVRTVGTFYKTDADATAAIMSCYNMMKAQNASIWTSFWMVKESLSDDIYTGGENSGDRPEYQELNTFTFGSTNSCITNIYRYIYMTIYRANLIVDNIKDPTPYQKTVIAEAKAIDRTGDMAADRVERLALAAKALRTARIDNQHVGRLQMRCDIVSVYR